MHDRSRAAADAAQASSGKKTLLGALILLAVLVLLAAAAIAHGGPTRQGGPEWLRAVTLVAGVCGASSLGGWFVARLGAGGPALAVSGSLGGIALRLLLPLLMLGWLSVDPTRCRRPEGCGKRAPGAFWSFFTSPSLPPTYFCTSCGGRRVPSSLPGNVRPPDIQV